MSHHITQREDPQRAILGFKLGRDAVAPASASDAYSTLCAELEASDFGCTFAMATGCVGSEDPD
ncbi:hypothetical protein WG898_19045 [Paucibacter sp. AS307]|uniref:hypothetical protein n=1 Tax=Paucibacter soli TaxID=3133433 RepID=UPI003098FDC8